MRGRHLILTLLMTLFVSFAHGKEPRTILSLTGGGIREVIPLEVLLQLKSQTAFDPNRDIDIYAGTSAGAIAAALLAAGMDVEKVMDAFQTLSKTVFSDPQPDKTSPKYNIDTLKNELILLFTSLGYQEDITLDNLPYPVIIGTTRLDDPEKNRFSPAIISSLNEEDRHIKVIDAILRSIAAPIYFASYQGHVDGGLSGLKDPSLIALALAGQDRHLSLLALGTGYTPDVINQKNPNWGFIQWATKLLPLYEGCVNQTPQRLCQSYLAENFLHIDFPFSDLPDLDNYQAIPQLIEQVDEQIESNSVTWSTYCSWVTHHFVRE